MPRLTNHDYLTTYKALNFAWTTDSTSLFLLDAMEQWALHEYYRLGENLDEATLIEHRQTVLVPGSSLPQRAGRAAAKWRIKQAQLDAYRKTSRPSRQGKKRSQDYEIRLLAEVKLQLNPDEFARIILQAWAQERRANDEGSTSGLS